MPRHLQSSSATQLSASKCASWCGDVARADQLLSDATTSAAIASGVCGKERFCRTGRSVTIRQDTPLFDTACKPAHRAYWRMRRIRQQSISETRSGLTSGWSAAGSARWQQWQLDRNLADSHRNPTASYLRCALGIIPPRSPVVISASWLLDIVCTFPLYSEWHCLPQILNPKP